ncbi:MAG: hypothetical protein ACXW30_01040 [Micavibrio sp.]
MAQISPIFNNAAGILSPEREEKRELLLSARQALFEMKDELAEAKANIPDIVGHAVDLTDKKAVEAAKAEYQSTLKVHVIDRADTPEAIDLMRRMYGLYERTFPLEEERERFDKLINVLGHNHDDELQGQGAPFRQHWVLVENPAGEIISGVYVSTFSAANNPDMQRQTDGTQHLTYIFVDPKYRAMGLAGFNHNVAVEEGKKFIAETYSPERTASSVDMLEFCEQNQPLKMDAATLLVDTAGAKMDQCVRRDIFEKMGYRQISGDFDYVQLPLRAPEDGGESAKILNLLVKNNPGEDSPRGQSKMVTEINTNHVGFHLENLFDRSFAAGQYDFRNHPDYEAQFRQLKQQVNLPVDAKLDFADLGPRIWNQLERSINAPHFDAQAFENQPLGETMNLSRIPVFRPDQLPDPKISRLQII